MQNSIFERISILGLRHWNSLLALELGFGIGFWDFGPALASIARQLDVFTIAFWDALAWLALAFLHGFAWLAMVLWIAFPLVGCFYIMCVMTFCL